MQPGALSLVTYTYNDHDFANALIAWAPSLGLPPGEIVVVDDASPVPYAPHSGEGVKVVRLKANAGPALVKLYGVRTASGGIVLSLDADIRPHAKWLRDSLPLLHNPQVGLVGASCLPALTGSRLGMALHRTSQLKRTVEAVPFTSGGCWLFRKEVWQHVGGIEGLPPGSFEDVFFCRRLLEAGYTILRNNRFPVYETRHLHRLDHCRRAARYFAASVASIINKYGASRYLEDLSAKRAAALKYFQAYGEPILAYVLLCNVAYLFHVMREKALVESGMGSPVPPIVAAMAAYPQTLALFREDMANLGMPGEGCPPPPAGGHGSMAATHGLGGHFPGAGRGLCHSVARRRCPYPL